MRRAVREIIRARQPHSTDLLQQVKVEQVGGWRARDCFNNSVDFATENVDRHRYKIVSGWIVGEFDPVANGTAAIQHYWNYDVKEDRYIDVTTITNNEQTYHYLIDTELMAYSQQPHIYDAIDDCVGHSLWFSDGSFSLVTKPFLTHIPISKTTPLSADLFYASFFEQRRKEVA